MILPRLFGHLAKLVQSIKEVLYESEKNQCYQKTSEI
jgi:hypothetical protein